MSGVVRIVEDIRDTVRDGAAGKARLDVVVATHEHKDHLSGFNQARDLFEQDFDFRGWGMQRYEAAVEDFHSPAFDGWLDTAGARS